MALGSRMKKNDRDFKTCKNMNSYSNFHDPANQKI